MDLLNRIRDYVDRLVSTSFDHGEGGRLVVETSGRNQFVYRAPPRYKHNKPLGFPEDFGRMVSEIDYNPHRTPKRTEKSRVFAPYFIKRVLEK